MDHRWDVEKPDDFTVPAVGINAVPCTDGTAEARILKIVNGEESAALETCPKETDALREPSAGIWACIRNLKGPHPGEPGKGGGILRVGDCILVDDATEDSPEFEERTCYDRHGPGQIRKFLKKKSQCRDRQGDLADYNTIRRDHPSLPVICHGAGVEVRTPGPQFENGECVDKPAIMDLPLGDMIMGGLDGIDCGDKDAWAKVVATVSERSCPGRADYEVSDDDHYPGTVCLRRF